MSPHDYREPDYAFGQAMLTLRTVMTLTQVELARSLGVSRGAVLAWEAGSSYPKVDRLKRFIEMGVKMRIFPAGRDEEEIRVLWQAAHQKVFLDEAWLSALLGPSSAVTSINEPGEAAGASVLTTALPVRGRRVVWEETPDIPSFYGREAELARLSQWVVWERCRVVSVLGLGGIGKSALSVTLMRQATERFEVVLFRSLRDAPTCEALLTDCLHVLSPRPRHEVSTRLEGRISLLLECLHERRVLLVLDNLEVLLQEGDSLGRFRPGFEGYGQLLRRVAETGHQSCLLLTSREKPADLVPLEGTHSRVRSLRMAGLEQSACERLLAEKELVGTAEERARLAEAYIGNPLALKIVAETIADLFGGKIGQFLKQDTVIFGGIQELLAGQVSRLSAEEQTVLRSLAIAREPLDFEELLALLDAPLLRGQLLAAVDSLRRRSLIERGHRPGSVTLQSVVLEYVTGLLIEEAIGEIEQGKLSRLIEHGLCQAGARDYVRQTQERLIVAPILERLHRVYPGRAEVEERLLALLIQQRERAEDAQGYGPANLVALLRALRGHLRGLDLSHLSLRGAYLQGVEMQDTTLARATLHDSIFTEDFDATWSVAISRNGRYWAAGGRRGEVRVWREEREEGQTLHLVWQAHTDTTSALAFSPDERRLVSGSWDGAITLWDLDQGAPLWTIWQTKGIRSLAFAPDGCMLASGGNDMTVRLWDPQTGTPLHTFLYPSPVFALAWSSDGRLLASSFDECIWVWQIRATQSATCIARLAGHTNWVQGLAFAPDGTRLASASLDRTVRLWDVASRRCLNTLEGPTDSVIRVVWSPDGKTLASCSLDKAIWLWDAEANSYREVLQGHTAPVYSIAFTPDSQRLLSGSEDGTLRVWDIVRGLCVRIVQGHTLRLFDVAWSPDSTEVASAGSDTLVTLWEVSGRRPPQVLSGHNQIVQGVAWSPDGKTLASSGWDKAIRLWDPATGTCIQVQRSPNITFRWLAWSPDGRLVASGSFQHGVQVWDVATRTPRWMSRVHPTMIRHVAWSPDGTRLASGGDEGSLYMWDASDGALLARLPGHRGMVARVVWSPDGTQLASAGGSGGRGELFLWNVHSGERLRAFAGTQSRVLALDWSPRDDLLVSGDSDGMLRWWDVQSGECVRVREAHQGGVQSLRISPDGHRLASCGDDGAIHLWDLESGERLRTLRRDRPYERLNITGAKGLNEAQKATLRALGAIEKSTLSL